MKTSKTLNERNNLKSMRTAFIIFLAFLQSGNPLFIGPTAPDDFWKAGFGQTLFWQGSTISYKMYSDRILGTWSGSHSQHLSVRLPAYAQNRIIKATLNGKNSEFNVKQGWITISLPGGADAQSCIFEITCHQ
jgi:hypothetical protein